MQNNSIRSKGEVIVASGAAIGLLLFELFFKWNLITSDAFVLDDAFLFERAVNERPFNDLGGFLPSFQAVDLDGYAGQKFYRFLSETATNISAMRLIYLGFFAVSCAIFSLVIYRVTRDRLLSVLISVFSFITPFSPVLVSFVSGSYSIVYFGLFFAGVLVGTHICPAGEFRAQALKTALMTIFLLLSTLIVEVGFLLSLAALGWLLFYTKAYESGRGRALFLLSGVFVFAQAIWVLLTYTSWYEAMPGRVNYELGSMFVNGISIIDRSISSFWDPMLNTGQLTLRSSLVVAIVFICGVFLLYAIAGRSLLQRRLGWTKLRGPLSFTLFLSVCSVLSIGPYAALKISHLWHYFPHMIFLCTSLVLLVYFVLSKKGAYILLASVAVLTTQTYVQQMPHYEEHVVQQKLFANFIVVESNSWKDDDKVILFFDGRILGGLNSSFRSTGFGRYVMRDPDLPIISITRGQPDDRPIVDDEGVAGQVYIFKMDQSGDYTRIS